MSFSDVADDVEKCLAEAERLGAKHTRDGRFSEYIGPLRQAASFEYPTTSPWPPDSRDLQLFIEGTSQAWNLLKSQSVWSRLERKVARHKLTKVLKGSALPEAGDEPGREARDILAEFSTAFILGQHGFGVRVTASDEDVIATCAGCPDLFVECKRPESARSRRGAVADAFKQLLDSGCDGTSKVGMVVVCIDRTLEVIPSISADMPGIPSFATLPEANAWAHRRLREHLQFLHKEADVRLCAEVPLALVLLTVPAFTAEEGCLTMLDFMVYNTDASMFGDAAATVVQKFKEHETRPD